jgi:hypothetical protein
MPSNDDLPAAELHFDIPSGKRRFARFYLFVIAACIAVEDVGALLNPGRLGVGERIIAVGALTSIGVLTVVWAERRMVKATVKATPSGLYIDNGFRKYIVRWSEVVAFENSWRPFQVAVKRTHGRPISMASITPGWFGKLTPQRGKVQELEAYWQRMISQST